MVATVDSPVKSEWDSKKPIHVDTWVPKEADMANSNKQWWVIDAEGMRLGRMATEIAKRLMGKHKVRPCAYRASLPLDADCPPARAVRSVNHLHAVRQPRYARRSRRQGRARA